jgi:taurine dioxygenase
VADARKSKLELKPIAGSIGVEVLGVELSKPISGSTFADIYQALLDHLAIFFPSQEMLPPDQLKAFAARFGEVDTEPFVYPFKLPTVEGHPEILNNVKEATDGAINFGGFWHADVTYRERPHKAAIMYAKEATSHGGDTMFANQYLAYETLSPGLQRTLLGLKAVHSSAMPYGGESVRFASVSRLRAPKIEDRSFAAGFYEKADAPVIETEHPVVRIHPETKRKSLYVNRGFTVRFSGMTDEESAPLLEYLWNHACRPEFTCRYRWSANDVVVWDNRCTLHYALNDYYGQRRVMQRVSVHEEMRPV